MGLLGALDFDEKAFFSRFFPLAAGSILGADNLKDLFFLGSKGL